MKRNILSFITALILVLCISLVANATPSQSMLADEEPVTHALTLTATPYSGGYFNIQSTNRYTEGTEVYLVAYTRSYFTFKCWMADGKEVSSSRSFYYTMPDHDATLTAVFEYAPNAPVNPEISETKVHRVTLKALPSMSAGYFNYDQQFDGEVGKAYTLYAYSRSNFTFRCWKRGDEIISNTYNYGFTMPDEDMELTAVYEYTPDNPVNPGTNRFDKSHGILTMDEFSTGYMSSAMSNALSKQGSSSSEVVMVNVYGTINSSDFQAPSNYGNCSIVDFTNSQGLASTGSYAYQNNSHLETIVLPASLKSVDYYSFYGCSALEQVVMYSTTPPSLNTNAFKNMNPEGVTLYVPDESLEAYKALEDYTSRFINVLPVSLYEDVTFPSIKNFEIEINNPDDWNDATVAKSYRIKGTYGSIIGSNGKLKYSVDGGAWVVLQEDIVPQTAFDLTFDADFNGNAAIHTLRIIATDEEGQNSKIKQFKYYDVTRVSHRGFGTLEYTGNPVTPNVILIDPSTNADMTEGTHYTVLDYSDNVDAGVASVGVEGIYPYTIGSGNISYTIYGATLSGTINLDYAECDFDGTDHTPFSSYTDKSWDNLVLDQDYYVTYCDNHYAGLGHVHVYGMGNYRGSQVVYFNIKPINLSLEDLSITYPEPEVPCDEYSHGITVSAPDGTGRCTITYINENGVNATPVNCGTYTVSLSFNQGSGYNAAEFKDIYTFKITSIDDSEWEALQALYNSLNGENWKSQWDFTVGKSAVRNLHGVTVSDGHITSLTLAGNNLSGTFPAESFALPYLKTLNLSQNALSGDVGLVSDYFPALETLNLQQNNFAQMSKPLSETLSSVNLSDMHTGQTIELNLAEVTAETLRKAIPQIALYNRSANDFSNSMYFNMNDGNPWKVAVTEDNGGIALHRLYNSTYEYHGQSGAVLPAYTQNGYTTYFCVKFEFPQGDIDFDGSVTASDLQAEINYAFNQSTSSIFNFTAADTYTDNFINVQDVVCLVNILIGEEEDNMSDTPDTKARTDIASFARKRVASCKTENAEAFVYVSSGKLMLHSEKEVAALDLHLDIDGKANWHFAELGMMQSTRNNHAVAYSLTGNTIPAGETILADIDGVARVNYASLSDLEANKIKVAINANATSMFHIAKADEENAIFSIKGITTSQTSRGINIIKSNGSTKKVFINK